LGSSTSELVPEANLSENARVPVRDEYCPVAKAADVIGDRWSVLMIREMLRGVRRFNELERSLPGQEPIRTATSDGMTTSDRRSDHAAYQAVCGRIRQGACAPNWTEVEKMSVGRGPCLRSQLRPREAAACGPTVEARPVA
jgi:hypothetical protein